MVVFDVVKFVKFVWKNVSLGIFGKILFVIGFVMGVVIWLMLGDVCYFIKMVLVFE